MPDQDGAAHTGPQFRRDNDFLSLYANNVRFELSVWDLKLIFGQLDQSSGELAIDQHTAVAISWAQAKLMSYYLQLNLAIHEADNGPITVPASVKPPKPERPVGDLANDPKAQALYELAQKMHGETFG